MNKKEGAKCLKCKYRSMISGNEVVCLYAIDMHEPRGCKFGKDCTKFEKGEPDERRRSTIKSYKSPPEEEKAIEQAYRDYQEFKHRRLTDGC